MTRRDLIFRYIPAGALALAGLSHGCGRVAKKRAYIIALDGLSADYIFATDENGQPVMKEVQALINEGVCYESCFSPLPAVTVCNHSAIITGRSPGPIGVYGAGKYYGGLDEKHQPITSFYPPGAIQARTFFQAVKERNPRAVTAVITGKGWVGEAFASEYVDVVATGYSHPAYVRNPESYVLAGYGEEKHCIPRLCVRSPEGKERLVCTLNLGLTPEYFPSDLWVLEGAMEIIRKADPDFMYILFAGPDDAGHIYGNFLENKDLSIVDNPYAIKDQVKFTDQCVGELVRFLKDTGRWDDTLVVITADHGMTSIGAPDPSGDGVCQLEDLFVIIDLTSPYIVDIRKILAGAGFPMRASDGIHPYNPSGVYEYCVAEGPNAYIYNIDEGYEDLIVGALEEYNRGHPDEPIAAIVRGTDRAEGINPYTGFPYNLYNAHCASGQSFIKWPQVFVFLRKNFSFPIYVDALRAGMVGFMKSMEGITFDVAFVPGLHGSFAEEHVPLVVTGGAAKRRGELISQTVSNLSVFPTLCTFFNINPGDAEEAPLDVIA